jgi:serine/threonine-protein kinase
MNELAGQSLGGYQMVEEIGHGSMGMVYRATQIALGREVAIKVLPHTLAKDAAYIARFIREAQIIAGLNHPNIVQIYDAGQQNGILYFVMEYVHGPTLGNLLQIDNQIPPYLAVEYTAQIADALDSAYHERHVIHRDIKPENLMLDRWGKIKVMDFGLARATGLQKITVSKTLIGSIYYASPEQLWGDPLDNRSDIYALGVVLYEMVCGRRPFISRILPELTQTIIRGAFPAPRQVNPTIDPALEQIILTALALDRNNRYPQAQLMAQALRSLNLSARSFPVSVPGRSQQVREKNAIQTPKRPQTRPQDYYFNAQERSQLHILSNQSSSPDLTQRNEPDTQPGYISENRPQYEYEAAITNSIRLNHSQATTSTHNPPIEDSTDSIQSRSRFWQQIQRLFKTS